MAIDRELVAQVRQWRLALRLFARDIERKHRATHGTATPRVNDPTVIEIEMLRTAADYLRDAERRGSNQSLERHLLSMLRDFRKISVIRSRQASLARDEPYWSLRNEARKTALDAEVLAYRLVIVQLEQMIRFIQSTAETEAAA